MEHPTHSDYAGSDPGVDVLVKCVCMSKHHKHVRHFRGIPRINIFAEILFSWKNISHVGDFPDAPSIHGMTVFLANGARAVVGTILINIEIDSVSELYVVVEARLLRWICFMAFCAVSTERSSSSLSPLRIILIKTARLAKDAVSRIVRESVFPRAKVLVEVGGTLEHGLCLN